MQERHDEDVWSNRATHLEFFEKISREYKIQQPSDWTKVTKDIVFDRGGKLLLEQYYEGSLHKVQRSLVNDTQSGSFSLVS